MELPLFIIPFCTLIADDTSKGTVFVIVFGVNQIPLPAGVLFPQFLLSRSAFAGPFHIVLDAFITRVTKMVTGILQLYSLDIVFCFTLAAFLFFLLHS